VYRTGTHHKHANSGLILKHHVTIVDWLLFSALVVCWGSSFVMSKLALASIAPEWVAAGRLVFGAIVLLVFAATRRTYPAMNTRRIVVYTWLGFIGNAAPFLVITWGIQFISSGVAGLLMGTIPLFIIVMSHYFLPDERLTIQRLMGFALGFIGVAVLIGTEQLSALSFNAEELKGELAIMCGCVMYGVNSVSAKRLVSGDNVVGQSAGILTAAALMSLGYAWFETPLEWDEATATSLWAVAALGLIPTGIATVIWFKAMQRTSPAFVSMSNYLVPVYALIFGAVILHETIGWNTLAALALILLGILVTRIKLRPSQ
jgi:drug/metabolite transporter (DMT)-like permease